MNLGMESEILEFKKSTSELEKGVISLSSMLNKHGEGTVYFGVSNDGIILGQNNINENTLRDVSRKISEGISPQIIPHISLEIIDNKKIIKVYASGNDIPYSAFDKYYSRSYDEDKKLSANELKKLFNRNGKFDRIVYEPAYNQDLTFETLKNLYINHGLKINETKFNQNMGLLTLDGRYNKLAELLADENNISILVVTFAGNDKTVMLKRTEYGGKCLISAAKDVLEYINVINETKVKLGGPERIEEQYFDFACFKEAWLNAVVHNRWINEAPPAVYIYDDRIEIISDGGLPSALTIDEYFEGVSKPVNKRLLEIFSELDLIDKTGHGVPTIVKKYGKDIFKIRKETIQIFIPINKKLLEDNVNNVDEIDNDLGQIELQILNVLKENNSYSAKEISQILNISSRQTERIISVLKNRGYIERVGSNKTGYWKVLK